MFGQEVADTVRPLTKQDNVDYKDLNNLKEYYGPILEDWRPSLVKAADIMHNFSTLRDASREKKIRKVLEAQEVYIPFLREARNKFPRFASFFYLAQHFAIEPLVAEMEERYETEDRLIAEFNEELKNRV
jgi:GTP pyrophosphokinase